MNKVIGIVIALLVGIILAACNGSAPTLTFAQQVSLVCNDMNTAIQIVNDDGLFTGGSLTTLNTELTPAVNKVCTAGATVTTPNLQALVNTGLPLLKDIVSGSALSTQAKADANTAIDLAGLAINTAITLAPQPTVPATPVSTPVAPSSMMQFHKGQTLTAEDLNRNFEILNNRLETLEYQLSPKDLASQ